MLGPERSRWEHRVGPHHDPWYPWCGRYCCCFFTIGLSECLMFGPYYSNSNHSTAYEEGLLIFEITRTFYLLSSYMFLYLQFQVVLQSTTRLVILFLLLRLGQFDQRHISMINCLLLYCVFSYCYKYLIIILIEYHDTILI